MSSKHGENPASVIEIMELIDRLNAEGLRTFADWCDENGFEVLSTSLRERAASVSPAEPSPVHHMDWA